MKPVRPYVDENRQVIFIEFEDDHVHDVVNGFLLAVVVFLPIAIVTPRPF